MSFSSFNEFLLAILLGIVQGVTEFLPISSTAHMRLVSEILIQKDIGITVSNILQFGTLIAIIQYFWQDLQALFWQSLKIISSKDEFLKFIEDVSNWWSNQKSTSQNSSLNVLLIQIILGTIPILITGFLFHDLADSARKNILNIAYFLIFGGVLISFAEVMYNLRSNKNQVNDENTALKTESLAKQQAEQLNKNLSTEATVENSTKSKILDSFLLTKTEVLTIGLFQCFAILPGVSRSGATLSGALLLGNNRATSVRFSFLLSIPAVGIAFAYDFLKFLLNQDESLTFLPSSVNWMENKIVLSVSSLLIALILSYLVGLICLKWLLKYIAKHDSRIFIVYRAILAVVIIWFMR